MIRELRLIALIAMALIPLTLSPMATSAQTPPEIVRTITTEGVGRISVEPDTATFSIGLEGRDTDLKPAQDDVSAKSKAIHDALIAAGVDEKDIATSYYNVQPVNKYDRNGNFVEVESYLVNLAMTITVRDITQVGSLVDLTVENGASYVGGISFYVNDPSPYIQQARQAAIADAKAHAQDYATGSDSTLTGVLTLTEASSPLPTAQDATMDRSMEAGSAPASAEPTTVVTPSNTEIIVTVQVVWTIEPQQGNATPIATPAN